MGKLKSFTEHLNEGIFNKADWVDLDLLQGTLERMRSDEYKKELKELNSKYPIDPRVKYNIPGE